jgi:colanic acid/amylovoran biosynthesis glycosyltransferase
MRVAYVVGKYLAVSHTFILREVEALRGLGVEVVPISINRSRAEDLLSQGDHEEAQRTFSVLPPHWPTLIGSHLRALATRPRGYLAAVRLASRLARRGVRGAVWELFYLAEAGVVWRLLHRVDAEHVHVHHVNQAADATMLALELERDGGRRRGWTWSFTMHGPDEFSDVQQYRLPEKARSANAIACISDFARSQAMAVLPPDHWPKLEVIHCGLDPERFRRSVPPRPGGGRPLHVVSVGRMTPVKGHALLVEALARLRDRGRDVTAKLIGDGPLRDELLRRVESLGLDGNVMLPGAIGQDDIRAEYEAADVFVQPSFAEGIPVVLMEAMALEVPVVATRIAGIPELVEDGVSGLVVAPGHVEALADAIERLAEDPALRLELGRRGREKVAREFSIDESARRLEVFFARTLASGSPSRQR